MIPSLGQGANSSFEGAYRLAAALRGATSEAELRAEIVPAELRAEIVPAGRARDRPRAAEIGRDRPRSAESLQ